jgi:hypothetical protein
MIHNCLQCQAFKAVGVEAECPECTERADRRMRVAVNTITGIFATYAILRLLMEFVRSIK